MQSLSQYGLIMSLKKHGLALALALSFVIGSALILTGDDRNIAHAQVRVPVVLVVDQNILFTQSAAGKNILEQAKVLRDELSEELKPEVESVQKEGEQLNAQAALLSPEVLRQKTEKLAQKARDLDKKQALKNAEFQASLAKARGDLLKELEPILNEILRSRSASLLLDSSVVLFSSPDSDITSEALKQIDEKISELKLERVAVDDEGRPIQSDNDDG